MPSLHNKKVDGDGAAGSGGAGGWEIAPMHVLKERCGESFGVVYEDWEIKDVSDPEGRFLTGSESEQEKENMRGGEGE